MAAEAKMYVVRRRDTGQFFKGRESGYLKNWGPKDPRFSGWTLDIELAKTYTLKGASSLAALYAKAYDPSKTNTEMEVILLRIQPGEVVKVFKKD